MMGLSYAEKQIPGWVAEAEAEKQAPIPSTAPVLANVPVRIAKARKKAPTQPTSPAYQGATAAAYEAVNKVLGQSGQRIEALGSDALQRWMQENGVEERDCGYWQRRSLLTGEMALVQVQPPKEVIFREPRSATSSTDSPFVSLRSRVKRARMEELWAIASLSHATFR